MYIHLKERLFTSVEEIDESMKCKFADQMKQQSMKNKVNTGKENKDISTGEIYARIKTRK